MPPLRHAIEEWLTTSTVERQTTSLPKLHAVIGTDIGLRRTDNQDSVAVLRYADDDTRPILCFALADGMGGMQAGAECARLTLASFFEALVNENRSGLSERGLEKACSIANEAVHERMRGKGGATLASVCFDDDEHCFTAYVGDSRIYGGQSNKGAKKLVRLSVDDNMSEAFGGSGQELVQFIGLGRGLVPHVKRIDQVFDSFYLTTDGVHFLPPEVLANIYQHAPDVKTSTDRLLALSRWYGGPDNATIAAVKLGHRQEDLRLDRRYVQVWGLTNELQIYEPASQWGLSTQYPEHKTKKERPARSRPSAKKNDNGTKQERPKQLDIEIEVEGAKSDEDR